MIYVIASLTVAPGKLDALRKAAPSVIEPTRAEPGCISYDLFVSATDPGQVRFVESWRSREALDEHFASAHMAKWRDTSADFFTGRKVEVIHPDKVEIL